MPFILGGALLTMGPIGLVLAHIQWLVQSNSIAAYICRNLMLEKLNTEVFDLTLAKNGQQKLVSDAKYLSRKTTKSRRSIWSAHTIIYSFLSAKVTSLGQSIVLSLVSLIPVLGPLIVNQITAPDRALSYLNRYLFLKQYTSPDIKKFKYKNLGQLACFGVSAGLFELIPLASMVTIMSNTVGAAIWSADLVKKEQKVL